MSEGGISLIVDAVLVGAVLLPTLRRQVLTNPKTETAAMLKHALLDNFLPGIVVAHYGGGVACKEEFSLSAENPSALRLAKPAAFQAMGKRD
ncbi:MAG: hypothetical protein LBU32_00565 [Clostridiales bacterium]|nr:hypothetical protein [Clostridiales bacterium]